MKLPFDLSVKMFFRLVFPGFFLTLGLLPLLFALLDIVGLEQQYELAFVFTTILVGWLIVAADMPIYILLEGRRYWPPFLRQKFHDNEKKRLQKLNNDVDNYYSKKEEGVALPEDERRYIEASVGKRSYPIGDDGERIALYPTRLGNAIAAFETYAQTRYELEAIFYWPRIWINLSKDLREEIDNQQAIADSAVYSTFSIACTGVFWTLYGLFEILEEPLAALLYKLGILHKPLSAGVFRYLPGFFTCFLIAAVCLLLSYGIYRLAVFTNEQFGTIFMAVIDAHVEKVKDEYVKVDSIVKKISDTTKIHVSDGEKLEVARRYLQYYNVQLPSRQRPVPFPKVGSIPISTKVRKVPPHVK